MLFTIVVSALRRSSLILLEVKLTKEQRYCNSSLSRKQFDAGKRASKDLMRGIKFQNLVAKFALNSINDFKVRCFQIQTFTFIVNSDVFCYEWRPFRIEMKLTFSLVPRMGCSFSCLEGGITVACLRHTLSRPTEHALAPFFADLR